MRSQLILILLITSLIEVQAQENPNETRPFQIGIVYPIGSNGTKANKIANVFSINLFLGQSAGVEAAEFSGFIAITHGNANGIQAAGFANFNKADVNGAHIAGFMNTSKNVNGFQSSGFANFSSNINGAQIAGFLNIADTCKGPQVSGFLGINKEIISAQASGFLSISTKNTGAQVSGFMNISREVQGSQAAGFMNIADNTNGPQVAGFMNVTNDANGPQIAGFMNKSKDVIGPQLSGFMNIARKIKGPQIAGFMNIADSSDYPIGILNFIKNGTKALVLETDENNAASILFKTGGRHTYGFIGLSYQPVYASFRYGTLVGIGFHFPTSETFRFDVDLCSAHYNRLSHNYKDNDLWSGKLRLLAFYKLSNIVSIFAGPNITYNESNNEQVYNFKGIELWNYAIKSYKPHYKRLMIGANAGLEINL